MIIVTTENIPNYHVREVRGPCFGAVVHSRGAVGNLTAGLRSLMGGEINEYSQLIEQARSQAIDRMAQNAAQLGANAIVMMRFDTADTDQSMMGVVAYGTAAHPDAAIVARGMADEDVERLIRWPFANVCSDGQSTGLHPRGFGSFPKVAGPYVRDKRLFSLEEAVRKMTWLAAENVGLTGRGSILSGQAADLVLFDPAHVADRADFGRAQAPAVGIRTVWVNGEVVYDGGVAGAAPTGVHSGRPLKRDVRRDKLSVSQFFRRAAWSLPRPN